MQITKEFRFEAAHQLPDEECFGECRNLHGHSYILYVTIDGEINSKGWVMNFKDLKKIVNELFINKYDHWFLNDYFEIPTAEIMTQHIFNTLYTYFIPNGITVEEVKLYETATSFAVANKYNELKDGDVKDHNILRDRSRIKVTIEGR